MPLPYRVALLLVIALTAVVYAPVGGFDFINWDDDYLILRNPVVMQGLTWPSVLQAFVQTKPFLVPLTSISFMMDISLFGLFPGGFHVVNVVIHLINVWLVGWLWWRMTGNPWAVVMLAGIFALHPQRVEAVAWITERKEVLSSLFGLLSLVAYYHHVNAGKGRTWLLASLMAMLASLLVKPAWVSLPALLLILDFWPLQRRFCWALIQEKIPFFLMSLLFAGLTILALAQNQILTDMASLTLWDRLGNYPLAMAAYLGTAFYPVDLSIFHPMPMNTWGWSSLVGYGVILLLIGLGWQQRHQQPYLLAGWLWFLAMLFPVSGVVTGGMSALMADRWAYIAHWGLAWPILWWLDARRHLLPKAIPLAMLLVLAILAGASRATVMHWQDSRTVWQQSIATMQGHPQVHYPHAMLGRHYANQGDHAQALQEFLIAAQMEPEFAFYTMEVGNSYLLLHQIDDAWFWYNRFASLYYAPVELMMDVGTNGLFNGQFDHAAFYWQRLVKRMARHHPEALPQAAFMNLLASQALGLPTPEADTVVQTYLAGPKLKDHCQHARKVLKQLAKIKQTFPQITGLIQDKCGVEK